MNTALQTLNTIGGWGFGFPLSPTNEYAHSPLYLEAANKAARNQATGGNQPYSMTDLWSEFKGPKQYEDDTGVRLTLRNYEYYGRAEISRLVSLGYNQANSPEITSHILTRFLIWAYPQAKPAEQYWHYVGANFNDLFDDFNSVVKTTGDIAENITNPISLSSLAVIAVIGAAFWFTK